jgi:hypothetical protein
LVLLGRPPLSLNAVQRLQLRLYLHLQMTNDQVTKQMTNDQVTKQLTSKKSVFRIRNINLPPWI